MSHHQTQTSITGLCRVTTVTVPGAVEVYGIILSSQKLFQRRVLVPVSRLPLLSALCVSRHQSISSSYFSDSNMLRD